MKRPHRLHVHSFEGVSDLSMSAAIARAKDKLDAWYQEQKILFWSSGASIFQFSTAAHIDNNQYVFTITVFDTRLAD